MCSSGQCDQTVFSKTTRHANCLPLSEQRALIVLILYPSSLMSSSSSAPKPKLPFLSLTTENPLCDIEEGGCSEYLVQLKEQANSLKSVIQTAKKNETFLTLHPFHFITIVCSCPLFSENHNILANKGYIVEFVNVDNHRYKISWKCPGTNACKKCRGEAAMESAESFM